MNSESSIKKIRAAKTGYIVIALMLTVAGAIMLNPHAAWSLPFCHVIGTVFVIFVIIKIIGYLSKDLYRLAFQYDLAFGIWLMILGIITYFQTAKSMPLLGILVGMIILADGLFRIQLAIDARRFGITKWWLILMIAMIAGILGVILMIRPVTNTEISRVFGGAALMAEGILTLCVALCTVKVTEVRKTDD